MASFADDPRKKDKALFPPTPVVGPKSHGHWKRFTNGGCPICNGWRRDCRQNERTQIVYCRDTSANPPGWRLLGEDHHGFLMWKEGLGANSNFDRGEWKRKQEQRRKQREAELARRLTNEQRHERYIAKFASLYLNNADRQDLERRGLTPEQIEALGAKSYGQGYGVPIKTAKGLILGAQVRRREVKAGESRYIWDSWTAGSSQLKNDELPIAVHFPLEWNDRRLGQIAIAEGTGVKPYVAAQRLGVPVLGGVLTQRSEHKQQLSEALTDLTKALQERGFKGSPQIILIPDGGMLDESHRTVISGYKRAIDKCASLGYSSKILWWGQVELKQDVDESPVEVVRAGKLIEWVDLERMAIAGGAIEEEKPIDKTKPIVITTGSGVRLTRAGYQVISVKRIWDGVIRRDPAGNEITPVLCKELDSVAGKGVLFKIAFFEGCDPRAISQLARLLTATKAKVMVADDATPEAIEKAQAYPLWRVGFLNKLTYEPTVKLNQRYLDSLNLNKIGRLTVIKSPKDTGKTTSLQMAVQQAKEQGKPPIVLSHLIQLCAALCAPDKLNLATAEALRQAQSDDDYEMCRHLWESFKQGMGLVINSAHPKSAIQFVADHFIEQDAVLIVDEWEQVLKSLLTGDHIDFPIAVQEEIVKLLKGLLHPERNGKVIVLDADMTDVSVNFILNAIGQPNLKPHVILNEFIYKDFWTVYRYVNKETWFAALCDRIKAGRIKHFITLDSQKAKGLFSSVNLEKRLKELFPHLKILRIDSQTLGLKDHPAFGCVASGKLNEIVQRYDIIIATPSIGTGISIDVRDYFDDSWGAYAGVSNVKSAAQHGARLRDPKPTRHIFALPRGVNIQYGGEINVEAIMRRINSQSRFKMQKAFEDELERSVFDIDYFESGLRACAEMIARDNAENINFADNLFQKLSNEGHQVVEAENLDKEIRKEIKEEMRVNRDQTKAAIAQSVAKAPSISEQEAERLAKAHSKTAEEEAAHKKHTLKAMYGMEQITPYICEIDDKGAYRQFERHFYLTEGREYLMQRDQSKVKAVAHNGKLWKPQLNKALIGDKVAGLAFFKIDQLAECYEEIHRYHPLVVELYEQALKYRKSIEIVFGFKIDQEEGELTTVRQFLSQIGFSIERTKKRMTDYGRCLHYQVKSDYTPESRRNCFEAIKTRRIKEMEQGKEADFVSNSDTKVSTESNKEYIGLVDNKTSVDRSKSVDNQDYSSPGIESADECAALQQQTEKPIYRLKGHFGDWLLLDIDGDTARVQSLIALSQGREHPITVSVGKLVRVA
ncbi:MAG: hypothetical protein Kow00121_33910 [Elainellaceae cyanobacterium]